MRCLQFVRIANKEQAPLFARWRSALAGGGETPSAAVVIEVVRFRGHWRTLHRKRHSPPFPDQAAALAAAKKPAIAKRKEGHEVKVVLQRTDGNAVVQAIDD
jgi:hypothetical protein